MRKMSTSVALICGMFAQHSQAQTSLPVSPARAYYEGWRTQEWTTDPRPYQIIRRAIDVGMPRGQKPEQTLLALKKYTPQDNSKLADSKTRFKSVYAFYRSRVVAPTNPSTGLGQNWQLLRAYPDVYNNSEWARLRFLLECYPTPRYALRNVGERLLSLDSKDFDVKYQLLRTLKPGFSNADKQRALTLADELVQDQPTRPSVYSARAGVHYRLWLAHRRQSEADKAIAAYREYLAIAPPNAPFRTSALKLIDQMRSAKNR